MRLWHILFAVLVLGVAMGVARDEVGRVALVVFVMTMGEVVLGTSALLMLFRTIGALGESQSLLSYLEATAATLAVLFVASATMGAVLWCGVAVLQVVVK